MEILGLTNFVQDDVNKLIAKFVGFQSKTAKAIEHELKKCLNWEEKFEKQTRWDNFRYVPDYFSDDLKYTAKWRLHRIIRRESDKLSAMRKITQRRNEFTKLRPWLRKFLLQWHHFYGHLFPKNGKTQKFIEEQIAELKMKRVEHANPYHSWTTLEW